MMAQQRREEEEKRREEALRRRHERFQKFQIPPRRSTFPLIPPANPALVDPRLSTRMSTLSAPLPLPVDPNVWESMDQTNLRFHQGTPATVFSRRHTIGSRLSVTAPTVPITSMEQPARVHRVTSILRKADALLSKQRPSIAPSSASKIPKSKPSSGRSVTKPSPQDNVSIHAPMVVKTSSVVEELIPERHSSLVRMLEETKQGQPGMSVSTENFLVAEHLCKDEQVPLDTIQRVVEHYGTENKSSHCTKDTEKTSGPIDKTDLLLKEAELELELEQLNFRLNALHRPHHK